jgi:hypothetical protein
MKALIRKNLSELRKFNKASLLEHCESRLATLSKRSVKEHNIRNEVNGNEQKVDLSRLNQETLLYIANALNKATRK